MARELAERFWVCVRAHRLHYGFRHAAVCQSDHFSVTQFSP